MALPRWFVAVPRSDKTLYILQTHPTRALAEHHLKDLQRFPHWIEQGAAVFDSKALNAVTTYSLP